MNQPAPPPEPDHQNTGSNVGQLILAALFIIVLVSIAVLGFMLKNKSEDIKPYTVSVIPYKWTASDTKWHESDKFATRLELTAWFVMPIEPPKTQQELRWRVVLNPPLTQWFDTYTIQLDSYRNNHRTTLDSNHIFRQKDWDDGYFEWVTEENERYIINVKLRALEENLNRDLWLMVLEDNPQAVELRVQNEY